MPSHKRTKAFTLIEILVTITIIGILAGIGFLSFSGSTEKARLAKTLVWSTSVYRLLGQNLKAQYSFNEGQASTCADGKDICDKSSFGNNCVLYNGPTWINSDIPGAEKAINFPGGSAYIDCDSNSGSSNFPALTVEFWIKPATLVAGSSWVTKNSGVFTISTSDTNGSMRFIVNGYEVDAPPGSLKTGQWTHVVATYDPGLPADNMKIYLNTQVIIKKDQTGAIPTLPSAPLIIGSQTNGIMEEVRIYGQGMPTALVKENYFAGLRRLYEHGEINKKEYQKMVLAN